MAATAEGQGAVAPSLVCGGAVARSSAASRWGTLRAVRGEPKTIEEALQTRRASTRPIALALGRLRTDAQVGLPRRSRRSRAVVETSRAWRPGSVASARSRTRGAGDREVAASLRPDVTRRGRESLPGIPRRRPAQVFYGLGDRWAVGMSKPSASTVPPSPRKTCGEKESNLHVPVSTNVTYPRNAISRTRPMTTLPGRPDARASTPVWPERMTPDEAETNTASRPDRQWQCGRDFVSGCIECYVHLDGDVQDRASRRSGVAPAGARAHA